MSAFLATAADGANDPFDTSYGREFVDVDLDNNLMRFAASALAPARTRLPTTSGSALVPGSQAYFAGTPVVRCRRRNR